MGVYEDPPGSGVWSILWHHNHVRHRERVGRKGDAQKLYHKRKADARAGLKLGVLRVQGVVTLGELVEDAVDFAKTHRKHPRDYESKAKIVIEALGHRPANEVTPQEIDKWITSRKRSNATGNRYKDFISIAYREGMVNGKVNINPARLIHKRKEPTGRSRYLSRQEYLDLCEIIERDNPEQLPSFQVSVWTGMRFGNQFEITWGDVFFKKKIVDLTKTKNGHPYVVQLNHVALAALQTQHARAGKATKAKDLVFPLPGEYADCRWWFDPALKEAGITNYSWHNNRHTFCSWCAESGLSLKEIQVLAGHRSITMSARYAHLSPSHAMTASERMATTMDAPKVVQ